MRLILGILLVAAAATAGDFAWYTYGVRHTVVAGLVHGALLLTVVGAVLGMMAGRVARGLPVGALAGVGGALAYYAFVALVDGRTYGSAIPLAWVVLWLLLATLDGRWLRAPAVRPWREVAARGALAAVLAGATFAAVLTMLWGRPPAGGRNYLVQFTAWTIAWAPGLLALTLDRNPKKGEMGSG